MIASAPLRFACLAAVLTCTDCELVLGLEDTVAARRSGPTAGNPAVDAVNVAGVMGVAGVAGASVGGAGAGAGNPDSNTPSSDTNGGALGDAGDGAESAGGGAIIGVAGADPSGGTPGGPACGASVCAVGSICARERTCLDQRWADWKMPNPGNSSTAPALNVATLLPNPSSYDTSLPDVVSDRVTLLDWQREVTSPLLSWTDSLSYCDELVLGGHDDWRLPTRIELTSLIDFSRTDPALDVTAFPSTLVGLFWTASRAADDSTMRWVVDFSVGLTDEGSADHLAGVRCVR